MVIVFKSFFFNIYYNNNFYFKKIIFNVKNFLQKINIKI
jgi:hypothetical protein